MFVSILAQTPRALRGTHDVAPAAAERQVVGWCSPPTVSLPVSSPSGVNQSSKLSLAAVPLCWP